MSGGCSCGPADPPLPRVTHLIPGLPGSIRELDMSSQSRRFARSSAMATGAADAGTAAMRARREEVVREHMESENVHDFDTTIGTFGHPRYEIVPTGDVYDGEEEVRRYFAETRA